MKEESKKEDLQANVLLSAYSIQDITALFSEIDKKIFDLHTCSSDDFLTLNAYFKKYYKDSKIISDNASSILNLITSIENKDEVFNRLKVFHSQLSEQLASFENHSNSLEAKLESIIQEIEHMFVPSNNLKQDLMTLKLLVANLKINITVSSANFGRMNKKTNDFNELISQTKAFHVELNKSFNLLKDQFRQIVNFISDQREKNSQNIGDVLTDLQNASGLFNQKFMEAQSLLPELKKSTEATANNIGKIITNLQYHDIIRQKIEHIQQTHKDILKELNQVSNDPNDEISRQIQIKCFLQIRDVAGLQAAQLIHTNKEYQKAIEVISDMFLQVGNEMTAISEICHQFISTGNNSSQSHFKDIIDKIERTSYFIDVFTKSISTIKQRYLTAKKQVEDSLNNYFELEDFLNTLEKAIIKSIESQIKPENEDNTINQIRQILGELRYVLKQHQTIFEKIKALFLDSEKIVEDYFSNITIEKQLIGFDAESRKIISSLNDNNEKVYKTISENQILSKQVSHDIKSSLEQIKYYELFDRTIDEIIGQLNEINLKLQNVETMDEEHRKANLEHLKARYTMQSEHIIHEKISQQGIASDTDIVNLDSTGADEEDDNLELF